MNYKPNIPNFDNAFKNIEFQEPVLPQYEDGESPYELLKSQSDYLRNVVPAIEKLANNSSKQAESAKIIADSSKTQSDTALEKSKKADIKGWIAIAISLLTLIWNIASKFIFS